MITKKVEQPIIEGTLLTSGRTLSPNLPVQTVKSFYNVPTSPATDSILKVMGSGKDNLTSLPAKAKQVNHSQTIEVLENGNKRQVTVKSNTATITLELSDIKKLTGSNKPAKKMFIFSLIKLNEQAYSGGILKRNYIQFSLQELIDIGYYSRPQSARKGFNDATEILTSLKVKGSMKQGKRETTVNALEVLYTGANIKNGTCTIFLNERVNWGFIASYYTIMPKYSFKLSNRAFDLMLYIFYLARQNVRDIEQKGYFNISLRAIQNQLQLPSEIDNKDPQRTLKEPIEKAIEEITNQAKTNDFSIKAIVDSNAPIAAFLNTGYLRIELKGNYATEFIAISKDTARQIQTYQKRKNAIQDKAKDQNLAKKIQSEQTS